MKLFLVLCVVTLGACQSGSGDDASDLVTSCPTFAGGLSSFEPQLDTFLEDQETQEHEELILNGSLVSSDLFRNQLLSTSLSLHLVTPNTSRPLYAAVSVWSLDTIVAPSGCATPTQTDLLPGADTEVSLNLACESSGAVVMQLCVTVSTQPFSALNGSYNAFTIPLRRLCQGQTTKACSVMDPSTAVPVEYCATRNQTRRLVLSGAGSWGVVLASFRDDSRGFCLVDSGLGGIIRAFEVDSISASLPVPELFSGIDVYLEPSRTASSSAFSFAVDFTRENESVLAMPYIAPPGPSSGAVIGRLNGTVVLPCLNPGFTKVNIILNTSGFIDGILYFRKYSFSFFRNCTPDFNSTLIIVSSSDNLGLEVGLPIALILSAIVVLLVVIVTVMAYLTRRYKHQSHMMEQQESLDLMSFSNAYVQSKFEDPFQFLSEYEIEYNYASLEVVGTLGEGAFGRVFKARAPGIHRGEYSPQEFVAVKTLKEGAADDVQEAFRSEVKVCVQFEHTNVIRLVGVCSKPPHRCMIFEYMDVGGLDDLLRSSDPSNPTYSDSDTHITPTQFLPIVLQLGAGLEYLASLKFIHRDVASRNCLVDHHFTAKIADFGMSRETNAMEYYRIGSAKACLPVRWMPPEALLYGKFTVKSDVWSYGVLVWEVYTFGRQPFSGLSNHEVIDKIKGGGCLECPELCTAPVYDVLKTTWTRAPSKRPTITTVTNRLSQLLSGQGQDEGYLNMGFGTVAGTEDLEEAKKIAEDSAIVANHTDKELT